MHKQRLYIVIAAGLGLVGCILPWYKIDIFFGTASYNGFNDWRGLGALAGLATAGVMAFMGTDRKLPIDAKNKKIIAGGGGAAVGLPLLWLIAWTMTDDYGLGSMGIGSIITLIAGVAVLGVPFAIKDDGTFSMPTKDSIKSDMGGTK